MEQRQCGGPRMDLMGDGGAGGEPDEDVGPEPEKPLAGRVALVTGAARRIGRVLAQALAGAGAGVVIHYRESAGEAQTCAAEIFAAGGRAALVQGDLADPEVAEGLIELAARPFGAVDLLVNNASIFAPGEALDTDLAEWELNQAINLRAPFLLSREFARALPPERGGDIVNLNDWRALRPGADHFAYTVSKVGLHGLTRSLAVALAPRIKVNEIALGAVLPPERATDEYLHEVRRAIPLDRWCRPREVAAALLFLAGAPGLTGQTIFVDGGRNLV